MADQRFNPKKLVKGFVGLLTFLVIAAALFQIQRLSRTAVNRAILKHEAGDQETRDEEVLDKSTSDTPPPAETPPDEGAPTEAPANGGAAPDPSG